MWDGGGFRVCAGNFVKLGKNMREREKDMIVDQNPDLGFTAHDSIHRDQN